MVVVVDTSVLIDHLRGQEGARSALRRAVEDGERLVASVLTKVEVLAGMRESERRATRRLLDGLEWADVDHELAERAGELATRYLPSHPRSRPSGLRHRGNDAAPGGRSLDSQPEALPDVP